MKRIMHWLVPKDHKFFEMLAEQSENAIEAAKELKNFIDNYSDFERSERKSRIHVIKNIEVKGDEITQEIIEKLNKASRVPIGKEDIRQMAILLDDIPDLINAVASRFVVLSIERIDDYIIKLVDIINNIVNEVNKAISDLKRLKGAEEHYVKIIGFEKEADEVYQEALSELFHFYKNSIDIIKYKEIYELLEKIADKCKDVANIIKNRL